MTSRFRDLPRAPRLLLQTYGAKGIGRRALYEAQRRSGYLERALPLRERFDSADDGWGWALRLDLDQMRRSYERLADLQAVREQVIEEAERTLSGHMRFYGWAWKQVDWPPRWHVNPWTGYEYPAVHWTQISDFQPERGDIKDVWEMSRLPFTCLLARAWVLTDDDRYAIAWWEALEDWMEHNPPNRGVNWKCGQETSLRGIAVQFGLMTFGDHESTTPNRERLACALLRASVDRVSRTLRYALSQRNNHAISETVFLATTTIGGLAPSGIGLVANRALREAIADQFYEDGWYAQHSFNYHRLALHALLWLHLVRSSAGLPVLGFVNGAIERSRRLLGVAQEASSGWMPNLGSNDGALLFPLSATHPRDFRPLLSTLGGGINESVDELDRTQEESIWLSRTRRGPREDERARSVETNGRNVKSIGGSRSHAVIRTGAPRHRANHDDQLHLDLWVDGINVLADPGTYRYTGPAPWQNALSDRRVHNVPFSNESRPRLGRFLPLTWPVSTILEHRRPAPDWEVLVCHRTSGGTEQRRVIVRFEDAYLVVDDACDAPFRTRWTFGQMGRVDVGADLAEVWVGPAHASFWGDVEVLTPLEDDPISAWLAPGYGQRRATTALLVRSPGIPVHALIRPRGSRALEIDSDAILAGNGPPEGWMVAV
jgi:hypothetical protein